MSTIFQKILDGDIPSAKVYEDAIIYVFMDAFPQSKGHTLIIPKVAEPDLFSMPDDTLSHIIKFSKRLALAQRKAFACDGIRVMQFNGEAAKQTVFHYHMHLMPMWHGQSIEAHADKAQPFEVLQAQAQALAQALEQLDD